MPSLILSDAEALLLEYANDSARRLEEEAQRLLNDARGQRKLVFSKIFKSHGEALPEGDVKAERDSSGQLLKLTWEKPE